MDWSKLGCLGWIGVFVVVLALIALDIWVACWLWGILIVEIFGAPALSFWQMFGLKILLWLLLPGHNTTNTNKK